MLASIVQQFFPDKQVAEVKPFGNGHINTTYKLEITGHQECFILQKINTNVFNDPAGIAETHLRLQQSIFQDTHPIGIAALIPTAGGKNLYIEPEGGVWRMTSFIEDSYTLEVVEEDWQAFEAGNAYGWFARACDSLRAETFKEPIKDFHRLSFRLRQLADAIKDDSAGRLKDVKEVVGFFYDRKTGVSRIEEMVDEGKIPLRVVHNDTKINNLLFKGNKAAAVIDLDTTGPGILYYDYGDALRTSASTAEEDERDLSRMGFNFSSFSAFTKGYMGQVKEIVSPHEKEFFYLAPPLMTYIMGIRFLADYLNGDVYYKTAYKDHNLDRTKTQMKLIESMEEKTEEMQQVIEEAC